MTLDTATARRLARRVAAAEFAGQNPKNIARQIRHEFEVPAPELLRLVCLETARLQAAETMRMYRRNGVTLYEIVTAGDELVCEACIAAARAGPYRVGRSIPVPVKHCKACRCTTLAVS